MSEGDKAADKAMQEMLAAGTKEANAKAMDKAVAEEAKMLRKQFWQILKTVPEEDRLPFLSGMLAYHRSVAGFLLGDAKLASETLNHTLDQYQTYLYYSFAADSQALFGLLDKLMKG